MRHFINQEIENFWQPIKFLCAPNLYSGFHHYPFVLPVLKLQKNKITQYALFLHLALFT